MIEAMICQAFSRIYGPLRLVKPMRTDAYQVQRNQSLEQERCDRVKLCFVCFLLSDNSHVPRDLKNYRKNSPMLMVAN